MKKFFIVLLTWFSMSAVTAQDTNINVVMPNPPGSVTDLTFRIIQKEYQALTGKMLVPIYAPGGDHIVAANKFKSMTDRRTVLIGSSSMHIFNYVVKDTLPYSDADFQHVAWIGDVPSIFAVNPNTGWATTRDMLRNLSNSKRPVIGSGSPNAAINVTLIDKFDGIKLDIAPYKSSTQVEIDLAAGVIDAAIYAPTSATIGLINEGKIRVIGNTTSQTIAIGTTKIPSVTKEVKAPQVNGSLFVSIKPDADAEFVKEFSNTINKVLATKTVIEALQGISVYVESERGNDAILKQLVFRRNLVKQANNK